ncbi:hypothetical protein KEJ29_02040 [Candidatus Bathyarchaeota archaeon]|nr:hypothetical protein [Candidatus Bathyarchaeota archaeon]
MQQRKHRLRKRVEGEFIEEGDVGVDNLVKVLIRSFLRADSDYGAISDIKTSVDYVYALIRNYISEEKLDIYALKIGDQILMSKTNVNFDKVYEVIREKAHLEVKKGIIEIWNDPENRLLHLLIIPLRKHFPIEYVAESDRERTISMLLEEFSNT